MHRIELFKARRRLSSVPQPNIPYEWDLGPKTKQDRSQSQSRRHHSRERRINPRIRSGADLDPVSERSKLFHHLPPKCGRNNELYRSDSESVNGVRLCLYNGIMSKDVSYESVRISDDTGNYGYLSVEPRKWQHQHAWYGTYGMLLQNRVEEDLHDWVERKSEPEMT